MKKLFLILIYSILFLYLANCQQSSEKWKVVWVVDGDTIFIKKGNIKEKVRLKGVDAPEIAHPKHGDYSSEYFGEESKQCLLEILEGKMVTIKYDNLDQRPERDKYNRLLAFVYLEGQDVNAKLIRAGCAGAFRKFPHSKLGHYKNLEKSAKE